MYLAGLVAATDMLLSPAGAAANPSCWVGNATELLCVIWAWIVAGTDMALSPATSQLLIHKVSHWPAHSPARTHHLAKKREFHSYCTTDLQRGLRLSLFLVIVSNCACNSSRMCDQIWWLGHKSAGVLQPQKASIPDVLPFYRHQSCVRSVELVKAVARIKSFAAQILR